MRKLNLLFVLLALLLGTKRAAAESVSPYSVDFNTPVSTSANDFKAAPGWGHVVSGYGSYSKVYPTYTYMETGGVDDSGCLKVGTQTSVGSGYNTGKTTDLLVPPAITGAASIMVKKTSTSGTIKFYSVTKDGTAWTTGNEIAVELPELSTDEYVKVDIPAQDGAYIGIWGSYVCIDNFTAESADVILSKGLTIVTGSSGDVTKLTSAELPDCNSEGFFPIEMSVVIQNTGEVELTPGMEGYSVSMLCNSNDNEVIVTKDIEQSLAIGETATVTLSAMVDYATHPSRWRYYAAENIGGTSAHVSWIEPVAYAPSLRVRDGSSYRIDSGTAVPYGMIGETTTKTFTIENTGAAPMTVTAITVPQGFSTDLTTPLTVPAHESVTLNVTLGTDVPGIFSGDLVISAEDIDDDFTLALSGTVLDPTKYFLDFEDNTQPAGTIKGDTWSIEWWNISGNTYVLSNSNYSTPTKFITPLLRVTEGEKMTFDASRRSTNSFINVYYSADRVTWNLLREIPSSEMSSTSVGSNKYAFTTFVLDNVPAGDWYIAFESGYARIDNIYGFELVPVDHDILLSSSDVPAKGMVNNTYTAEVSISNLRAEAEDADSYTATLYVGGEAVATAAATELGASATGNYEFSFTPHAAGTFTAYVEFAFGESYRLRTAATELTIAEETAAKELTVGTKPTTANKAVVSPYYKNSASKTIYTAEMLAAAGLTAGSKITKLTYNGYNTSGEVTATTNVWIANTEDTEFAEPTALPVTDDMTLIMSEDYVYRMQGASLACVPMLEISLTEPFVYTGGSLVIAAKAELVTSYKQTYFEVDATDKTHCYAGATDAASGVTSLSANSLPVVTFAVQVDPQTVTGTVTDISGAPAAGAKVTLRSGDVEYYATTADDGTYTVTVYQTDGTYSATVELANMRAEAAEVTLGGTWDAALKCYETFVAGKTQTIILPTAPDDTKGRYYAPTAYSNGTVTLERVRHPEANVPYVIIPDEDYTVEVESAAEAAGVTTAGTVTLTGTYSDMHLKSDDASAIYTADGTGFVKAAADEATAVTPLHAWFSVPAAEADGRDIVFNFDGTAQRDISLTINVTAPEGEDLAGQVVTLKQTDFGLGYGTLTLNAGGSLTVAVYEGPHALTISRPGYATTDTTFTVTRDATIEIELGEDVRQPFSLKTEVEHDVFTGLNSITLTWNKEDAAFFDNFDSYEPFATSFGEWTGIDGDNLAAAALTGEYMNRGVLQYAQIISPLDVEPTWWYDYPVLRPYSGRQYAGFTRTDSGAANDDWLISPVVTPGTDNKLTFMAKAADQYDEKFQVYVTEKLDNPAQADFTMLSEGNYETVDYRAWRKFAYDLSQYAGRPLKFAIRYIGSANNGGAFMLMVDDVYVGQDFAEDSQAKARRVAARSPQNPNETFHVYLNGEEKATTDGYEYTFSDLPAGTYTLGVKAAYKAAETDIVTTEVTITDDRLAAVTFNVATNNGTSADGLTLELTDETSSRTHTVSVAEGKAAFPSLPYGKYLVGMKAKNFDTYEQEISVEGDATFNVTLKETITDPYNITADVATADDGTHTVTLRWNQMLAFRDSFESYDDFATGSFGDWLSTDFDQHIVYPIGLGSATNIVTFPGASTPTAPAAIAPMVFNPWATTPAMLPTDDAIKAPTGDKTVVFFSPQTNGADKWLISPEIDVRDGYVARFTAKAYGQYKETMTVGVATADISDVTTTGGMLEAFTEESTIDGVSSGEWTIYETDISKYAGQKVRIGIHYTTYDGFFTQIDDFFAGVPDSEGSAADVGAVKGYEIWLDGEKAGESTETEYVLTGLGEGTHKAGVKAIYASGESAVSEIEFTIQVSSIGSAGATVTYGPAQYYSLTGQKLDAESLPKGVIVVKDSRGTRKVLNK